MIDQLFIDGPNIAYRSFHAMRDLATTDGRHSAALHGMASTLCRMIDDYQPKHLVVCWEGKGSRDSRVAIDSGYKAKRTSMPEELATQMGTLRKLVESVGAINVAMEGAEADDVIASLVHHTVKDGRTASVLSSDRDLFALLAPGIHLLRPIKAGGLETWDVARFERTHEMKPVQWTDKIALAGDPGDGIKGVKGIGEQTAVQLLKEWGNLDNIYAHLEDIAKPRTRTLLEAGRDDAYRSRQLAVMNEHLDLDLARIHALSRAADLDRVQRLCDHWELAKAKERLTRVLTHRQQYQSLL